MVVTRRVGSQAKRSLKLDKHLQHLVIPALEQKEARSIYNTVMARMLDGKAFSLEITNLFKHHTLIDFLLGVLGREGSLDLGSLERASYSFQHIVSHSQNISTPSEVVSTLLYCLHSQGHQVKPKEAESATGVAVDTQIILQNFVDINLQSKCDLFHYVQGVDAKLIHSYIE